MEKLAIFDYDNTLSSGFAVPDVCIMMERKGFGNEGFTKDWNKLLSDYEEGRVEYNDMVLKSEELIRAFLDGFAVHEFMRFVREQYKPLEYIYPWVPDLFHRLRKEGWMIAVISGALTEYLEVAQDLIDFDFFWGSEIEKDGSVFGNRLKVIMNHEQKATVVRRLRKSVKHMIGMGDSEGDLQFLKLVDTAFMYNPKDKFAKSLKKQHPKIVIINETDIANLDL